MPIRKKAMKSLRQSQKRREHNKRIVKMGCVPILKHAFLLLRLFISPIILRGNFLFFRSIK